MKISVITAVYNRANTIGSAIESVRAQSHPDVEHIIQDGGSRDGTLDIVRAAADGEIDLVSEADGGIYDAINRGIARAKGDVIGLMHSDDFFASPEVLAKVANAFTDPLVDGVYGDLEYVRADDIGKVVRYWRAGSFRNARLRFGWMPPHPTLYLRREVFARFGSYDTSFRIAADYDAMLRYLSGGQVKIAYIPEVMVRMRLGGESNRSFERVWLKSREDYRAIRKNGIGGLGTLAAKNLRKLNQFFTKDATAP